MIVAAAAAYVSTKQAQRNTKEVWKATGTVVELRNTPRAYQQFMHCNQFEYEI